MKKLVGASGAVYTGRWAWALLPCPTLPPSPISHTVCVAVKHRERRTKASVIVHFQTRIHFLYFFYILLSQHQIKSKGLTRTIYLCWLLRSQTCDLLNSVPLAHNSEEISISKTKPPNKWQDGQHGRIFLADTHIYACIGRFSEAGLHE